MVWRDDINFLCELGHHYRYYLENKDFAKINSKVLPNTSNARWNSRGILALLAFILLPEHRQQLQPACNFIASEWMIILFSNHYYD